MRLPTVRRWVAKTFFLFLERNYKKTSKESLIIMARFLRDAKHFSLKFSMLSSFVPAESLAGDVQSCSALCRGIKATCGQPKVAGESSSCHCITQPCSALYCLALGLGPGPMPIKLVRAQTRLMIKLISHC